MADDPRTTPDPVERVDPGNPPRPLARGIHPFVYHSSVIGGWVCIPPHLATVDKLMRPLPDVEIDDLVFSRLDAADLTCDVRASVVSRMCLTAMLEVSTIARHVSDNGHQRLACYELPQIRVGSRRFSVFFFVRIDQPVRRLVFCFLVPSPPPGGPARPCLPVAANNCVFSAPRVLGRRAYGGLRTAAHFDAVRVLRTLLVASVSQNGRHGRRAGDTVSGWLQGLGVSQALASFGPASARLLLSAEHNRCHQPPKQINTELFRHHLPALVAKPFVTLPLWSFNPHVHKSTIITDKDENIDYCTSDDYFTDRISRITDRISRITKYFWVLLISDPIQELRISGSGLGDADDLLFSRFDPTIIVTAGRPTIPSAFTGRSQWYGDAPHIPPEPLIGQGGIWTCAERPLIGRSGFLEDERPTWVPEACGRGLRAWQGVPCRIVFACDGGTVDGNSVLTPWVLQALAHESRLQIEAAQSDE